MIKQTGKSEPQKFNKQRQSLVTVKKQKEEAAQRETWFPISFPNGFGWGEEGKKGRRSPAAGRESPRTRRITGKIDGKGYDNAGLMDHGAGLGYSKNLEVGLGFQELQTLQPLKAPPVRALKAHTRRITDPLHATCGSLIFISPG